MEIDEMVTMQRSGRIRSSVDYGAFMDFGDNHPMTARSQRMDNSTGETLMTVTYIISDKNDFIKEVKKRAWHHWNHQMDEQIGEVLEYDDTKG